MVERRRTLRRVTEDRRKGERRAMQAPVDMERRATGDRRKAERRLLADRREGQ